MHLPAPSKATLSSAALFEGAILSFEDALAVSVAPVKFACATNSRIVPLIADAGKTVGRPVVAGSPGRGAGEEERKRENHGEKDDLLRHCHGD